MAMRRRKNVLHGRTMKRAKASGSYSCTEKMIANGTDFAEAYIQIVKQFAAILFSLLLVWMPFAPAPAFALPACPKHTAHKTACSDPSCGMAGCCVTKPDSDSQPAPAVPAQKTGEQNQTSLLVPTAVVWTLPENPANSIFSVSMSPITATGAPLYARNCALLL
jgi:hypothetical protein